MHFYMAKKNEGNKDNFKELAELLDGLDLNPSSSEKDIASIKELMAKYDVNDFFGPPLKE